MHHWCIHLMRMHIFITKWTPRNRLSGLVMVTMYYTDWWKYLYTCSCTYISDEHLESEQSCFAIWNLDDFTAICIFPTTSIAPPTTADYDLKILSDLDSVNVFQNNDKQSQSAVLYKSVMLQKRQLSLFYFVPASAHVALLSIDKLIKVRGEKSRHARNICPLLREFEGQLELQFRPAVGVQCV